MSRPIITLTTDFGQADAYVGIMKGVMLAICPEAILVDISHEIRPQQVQEAAYLFGTAVPYFPAGTVHLVVVDPGVGSGRRAVAIQTSQAFYVAPDNGVLSRVLVQERDAVAVHLTAERYRMSPVSATFHGRDVFAPAAAYLAAGVNLHKLGEEIPLDALRTLPWPDSQVQPDGSRRGVIIHVDHFGNLVTSISGRHANPETSFVAGGVRIPGMSRTFSDVAPGEFVAYTGSGGYIEIAIRGGSAAARLQLDTGDPVEVHGPARE